MKSIERARCVLDSAVREVLVPTLGHGFAYEGAKITRDALLGEMVVAEFVNASASREILVEYIPKPVDPRGHEVLIVHVGNRANGTFSVNRYAEVNGLPLEPFRIAEAGAELRARMEMALRANAAVLRDRLAKVLHGDEWIEVPIDWCGYK